MKKPLSKAFTLVEVVLVLGVIGASMIPLMGLMGLGVSALHQSLDMTTETLITQKLASEIAMLDYSKLGDYCNATGGFPRYFDDEGQRTDTSAGAIYRVGAPALEGCRVLGEASDSSHARKLTVTIEKPTQPSGAKTIFFWIVDNGR